MATLSTFTKRVAKNLISPIKTIHGRYLSASVAKEYKYNGANEKPTVTIQNHHIDSSVWSDTRFQMSDNDIYVVTPAKAGTTWTQEILGQLLYNGDFQQIFGDEYKTIHDLSPWLTLSLVPRDWLIETMNAQLENSNIKHRVIKLHEQVESVPFNKNCKYIFVARDYRDIVWSIYNHYAQFTDAAYEGFQAPKNYQFRPLPQQNFEDGSFTEYDLWQQMLSEGDDDGNIDGWPWWSQLNIIGSWWNIRNLPNVKLVHYNDLKADLSGSMRGIAEFCNIEVDEKNFNEQVEKCTFESMKQRGVAPINEKMQHLFKDKNKFFNKGTIGRWKDVLTDQDTENYRRVAKRYLDENGIRWLETGIMQ